MRKIGQSDIIGVDKSNVQQYTTDFINRVFSHYVCVSSQPGLVELHRQVLRATNAFFEQCPDLVTGDHLTLLKNHLKNDVKSALYHSGKKWFDKYYESPAFLFTLDHIHALSGYTEVSTIVLTNIANDLLRHFFSQYLSEHHVLPDVQLLKKQQFIYSEACGYINSYMTGRADFTFLTMFIEKQLFKTLHRQVLLRNACKKIYNSLLDLNKQYEGLTETSNARAVIKTDCPIELKQSYSIEKYEETIAEELNARTVIEDECIKDLGNSHQAMKAQYDRWKQHTTHQLALNQLTEENYNERTTIAAQTYDDLEKLRTLFHSELKVLGQQTVLKKQKQDQNELNDSEQSARTKLYNLESNDRRVLGCQLSMEQYQTVLKASFRVLSRDLQQNKDIDPKQAQKFEEFLNHCLENTTKKSIESRRSHAQIMEPMKKDILLHAKEQFPQQLSIITLIKNFLLMVFSFIRGSSEQRYQGSFFHQSYQDSPPYKKINKHINLIMESETLSELGAKALLV